MEQYLKQINEDIEVKKFASKLSQEELENNICLLLEQVRANKICNACQGKKECLSDVLNMQSYLIKNTSVVTREYYDCTLKNSLLEDGLDILYFPSQMELGELYPITERQEIYNKLNDYKNSDGTKGIYLYGSFGTGKTYIMLSLAKYLAKKGKKVIFAYYPELVRSVKSAIANNTLEKLIVKLKNVDVLMLDDFGAELNSNFIRDEFLGPILQYRYMAKLPIFVTSNYDINTLKQHLADTKEGLNVINASRIIERLVCMMDQVKLNNDNFRA